MPTAKHRVQVTIDDEFAEVLNGVDPSPASRSRLIRDLAVRGAEVVRASRSGEVEALTTLLEIADGARDYDLAAAAAAAAARADRLP